MNQLLFLATLFCDIHVIIWFAVIFHGALYRKKKQPCRQKFENCKFVAFMPQEKFTTNNFSKTSWTFSCTWRSWFTEIVKKNKNKNPMKYCSRSICLNLVKSRNFFNNLFDFKLLCCALIQFQWSSTLQFLLVIRQ